MLLIHNSVNSQICLTRNESWAALAADVQAALTVIGRDAAYTQLNEMIDLSDTCLARAVLTGNLTGAFLDRADLTGASF